MDLQQPGVGFRQEESGAGRLYRNSGVGVMERSGTPVDELLVTTCDVVFGASGSVTLFDTLVPQNAKLLKLEVSVDVAFDAGTTNVFLVGTSVSPFNQLAASGVIDPTSATLQSAGLAKVAQLATNVQYQVTYNQTGTAAAHGHARFSLYYALP